MTNDQASPASQYLGLRKSEERIAYLDKLYDQKQYLPITLVNDLLCLDLPLREQSALVRLVSSSDNIKLEHFFTNLIPHTHQDVAVTALREWGKRTEQRLWFRLVQMSPYAHLSQRLRYSMLDVADRTLGLPLLEAYVKVWQPQELSPAFHELLFRRALEWNFESRKLRDLAQQTLTSYLDGDLDRERAVPLAISYLIKFGNKEIDKFRSNLKMPNVWMAFADGLIMQRDFVNNIEDKLKKFFVADNKTAERFEEFKILWPSVFVRSFFKEEAIYWGLNYVSEWFANNPTAEVAKVGVWFFAGINDISLVKAVCQIANDNIFTVATTLLEDVLASPYSKQLLKNTVQRLQKTDDPQKFLQHLSPKIRLALTKQTENDTGNALASKLDHDKDLALRQVLHSKSPQANVAFVAYENPSAPKERWLENESDCAARKTFFDLVYRNQANESESAPINKGKNDDYWGKLLTTWHVPNRENLQQLTIESRKVPALWQVCFLQTLGRFKGENEAALKLMDFIRTDEEIELRAIINALRGIETPRATQELVSAITRPNINATLQMEICHALRDLDLSGVQGEIRSAINDINPKSGLNENRWEIKEALEALLVVNADTENAGRKAPDKEQQELFKGANSAELDASLAAKIQHYQELSSEVRRALRTAEFFYQQVNDSQTQNVIDLSPVIDMQYKAMELTFRELFEDPCKDFIHMGVCQRKLDIIGYARPIEEKMTQFENYIASLPVINTIPFFSKFKLRKMLRAICQFRPGRRFTLDGLKAFGLFFLCFSRKDCKYGLKSIFPLEVMGDLELAEFCKKLHVFQDFRNRAAHEGFHPEASQDMEEIWRNTGDIVISAFKIKSHLMSLQKTGGFTQPSDAVKGFKRAEGFEVIVKKVG